MEVLKAENAPSRKLNINKQIYHQLDVWRAIAAIWVVMDHACSTVITDPKVVLDSASFLRKPYVFISLSGQLGVAMFFVISGYCIVLAADNSVRKQRTFIDFLKARLRRIYPPYYASIVLAVILPVSFIVIAKMGLIPMPNHQADFFKGSFLYYFSNLTLTQEIFHIKPVQAIYWSLCYEVAFYFIVTICMVLSKKLKINFHMLIIMITLGSLVWCIFSPETCLFPFNLWYLFGLGAMVYMLNQNIKGLTERLLFVTTCVLVIIYAYVQPGTYRLGHPSTQEQAIFGLLFSLVIWLLYRFDGELMKVKLFKAIAYLGTMSYSIYLSHSVVITIPRQLMIKSGFINEKYWITFAAQVIVAIVFGYVFHIFCERPFMSSNAKVRDAKG